jgi:PAS domain S-box-containing protein
MKNERRIPAQKSTEILVAEDSITQATQIKHLLESHHYKVTVAQNGKQALDRLTKHKPSLVITDIVMPEINGYELCKKIKSNKNTEDIPVILLTILADPEEIIEGLSCGADSFITKPYNEKYLLSHIERILSKENVVYHEKVPFSAQILFKGKKRFIQAEQQNVIRLMLEIYEGAIQQNEKLIQTREELRLLNERLESLVEDRTSDLTEEIKLSNQIADRLKKSEEKWRTLVTTIPEYIGLVDCEGKFLFLNHYAEGFSEKDTIGKGHLDFIPNEWKEFYQQKFEKCISTQKNQIFEYAAFGDNYAIRTYETCLVPVIQQGKVSNVMAIARDITERKLVEETIRILAKFPSENPDPVLRIDLNGRLLYANEASYKVLTWKLQIGKIITSTFQNIVVKTIKEGIGKVIETEHNQRIISFNIVPVVEEGYANLYGRDITKRKQAEEALQESQHLFQTLAQVSPVGIFRTNPDGNTTYVNPKYLDLSGLSSEEAYGIGWLNAVHPEDRGKLSGTWLNNFKSKRESGAEYRFLKPDGSIVWVIGKAVPELIGNEVTGYIGTITDITGRKWTEEVLRESESSLRDAQEIAKMGSWEWDMVTQKTNWSDNYFAILRFKPTEVEPGFELFRNRIHPDDVHFLDEIHAKIMKDKTPFSHELRLIQTDDTVKWIQNNISPVIEDDKLVKLKGVIIDITERKQAEKALRESEMRYKTLFFNAAEGIIVVKTETMQFLYTNPAICKMFGYTEEELMRLGVNDIHPKESLDYVMAEFEAQMRGEKTLASDLPCLRKDGTLFHADIRTTSMVIDGFNCNVGFFIDITERKQATEKLKLAKEKAEASDKLKTTFLNNISHEVRTPLNGILGFAEIMSQADLSEEDKQLSLSMLFESSDRLLNTITNYMDISLITSGNMVVNKKDFVPEKIMKEFSWKYKTICSARKLELLLKMPEHSDKLSINTDPEILNKIISHLLSNAIKFTEKGSIKYGYTILENEIEFFVKDTGIGIGEGSLKNIFKHFVKEDRGPLELTEGSGLGLSIAKGLVELLGGKIRVESERGKGSGFFFTIPQSKENETHHSVLQPDPQDKNKTIKSILVAEDDETNFFYLKALLKQNTSADIIHASNGREAIEKFKENPEIGLVLMDIKMPVMDGLEATRQIKAINRDVPVIAITAYAMAGDEARILDAGCDYFLSKPINKKLLLARMSEYISL